MALVCQGCDLTEEMAVLLKSGLEVSDQRKTVLEKHDIQTNGPLVSYNEW